MDVRELEARFRELAAGGGPRVLRYVRERDETISVRRGVLQPVRRVDDVGALIQAFEGGGVGYAATPDLSRAGLREALDRATAWARATGGCSVPSLGATAPPAHQGRYASPVAIPWASVPLAEKIDRTRRACEALRVDERIVDWGASLWHTDVESIVLGSTGGCIEQRFAFLVPMLSATANEGSESQTRTLGGHAHAHQGGLEVLDRIGWDDRPTSIGEEALELLAAPDCPSDVRHLLAAPDQMAIQIHESIGHPLELDRILGDERNYAGRSFVTPDMIGSYRYGSDLLTIRFDPTVPGELASYAFDDEGQPAVPATVIDRGLLVRSLGGHTSRVRAGLPGVATARASSWKRPAIDRMANLNLEPGSSTFEEMVASVERGALRADELLVVDRRLPQQVPVQLRAGHAHRGRAADHGRSQAELPGRVRDLLAEPGGGRGSLHPRGPGNAVLRQG